jgi:alpha-tubulin suppressor-like RCC1 family protein
MSTPPSRAILRTSICELILGVALIVLMAAPAAARAAAGPAVSWGENRHGELGAIYRDDMEERPVSVEAQTNVAALAAGGGSNLALLGDGTVTSWGGNASGQLGDGTRAATWEKGVSHVVVGELSNVAAVAASGTHSLALLGDGSAKTWGNNQFGQLGNGGGGFERETHEYQNAPRTVNGLSGGIAIAAGSGTNFVVLADHTVKAWGWDRWGQLGIAVPAGCAAGVGSGLCPGYECKGELGWQLCSKVPQSVEITNREGRRVALGGATAVAAGAESAYALLQNGHVVAWGANSKGQLGIGPNATAFREANVPPTEVVNARTGAPLSGVLAISAGYNHALALLESGEVVGWGNNEKGALGPASESKCGPTPCDKSATVIPGLGQGRATAVSAGVQYSLALSAGKVYAVGKDEHGELGDGRTVNAAVARAVPGLEHVTSISAGETHAAALLASGSTTPPPAVTLAPGRGSLGLGWALGGSEQVVIGGFEGSEPLPQFGKVQPGRINFTKPMIVAGALTIKELNGKPLETRPYELRVKVTGSTKKRVLVGTPLP